MAHAPRPRPGRGAGGRALRGDPPLTAERPGFEIDPSRLYEVAADGTPHTRDAAAPPMEWLGDRHRRMILAVAAAAGLVGALAGLTVACFVFGARLWAAGFALATLAAVPLLGLGPGMDWWRHRRRGPRHVHRQRPEVFGRGGARQPEADPPGA